MNPLLFFRRPEYFWRPSQAARRLLRIGKETPKIADVVLPWGAQVRVHTQENVGSDIFYYGIFDPIVPEAIWRLMDLGGTGVDIGANIGQNTSAMAYRAGRRGSVLAFEPHPEIFSELERNCKNWMRKDVAEISLEARALGSSRTNAYLADSPEFTTNRGSASLISENAENRAEMRRFPVTVETLDFYTSNMSSIDVCKIDVEGYELSVLEGACKTLSRGLIRDVVFEDFNPMPSTVSQLLESYGFTIFRMTAGSFGPALFSISHDRVREGSFSYNYLATRDSSRAIKRFRFPGWRCLLNL